MSVVNITNENFEAEVLRSDIPVLVDFWAPWCGPCKMVGPVIDEISHEQSGAKVCKINVDEQPSIAGKYRVMSIPTLLVFKDGAVVNQVVGARSKDAILELIK